MSVKKKLNGLFKRCLVYLPCVVKELFPLSNDEFQLDKRIYISLFKKIQCSQNLKGLIVVFKGVGTNAQEITRDGLFITL